MTTYHKTSHANVSADVPPFVRTLYAMLQTEDPRILSWSADGTHFQVHDVSRLEREVLARYFKHTKFSSFQRQLNNFGFHKWTKTRASVATFSHEVLRRCRPSELAALARQMRKKTTAAAATTPLLSSTKRRLADTASAVVAKKQKVIVAAVDDLDCCLAMDWSFDACTAVFDSVWSVSSADLTTDVERKESLLLESLLLESLDAVELLELDWDATTSSTEVDGDCDCSPLDLLGESDVFSILEDLDGAEPLSKCELEVLVGNAELDVFGLCDDAVFALQRLS